SLTQNLSSDLSSKPGLRLILLGPSGGGRSSLADTLLGNSGTKAPTGPLMESTKRRAVVDGREVTVIDTPDLLGPSLGNNKRAREALQSLQLVSPGPHAFLLVVRAPGSSIGIDQDAAQAIRATLELFGDVAAGYIIPVLTHADRLGRRRTVDQLLDVDTGALRNVVSLCGQRPELVDNRPDCPPEAKSGTHRQLVERVMETKDLREHFVHELQRTEDLKKLGGRIIFSVFLLYHGHTNLIYLFRCQFFNACTLFCMSLCLEFSYSAPGA
uniref:AIG1-type G domain-containing protein n=1 Tax=Scophthalmus maximus TaxID=52904 RepID=A0A8D3CAL7_SCOMX